MLTQTQRDNILAIINSYEARMKIIRDCFDRREPVPKEYEAYVDPLKDKDVVAAFESLTILLACVQELEQQRDFFLKALNDNRLCPNGGCFHDGSDMDEWDCTSYDNRECWITAAKEAGNE